MATNSLTENYGQTIRNNSLATMLEKKYAPYLEGVTNKYLRRVMAFLFENTLATAANQSRNYLFEETRASAAGPYIKYIFPMIRRAFANLIAPNIVSVQPMTSPVSGIFFYRYRYSTTKGGVTAGQEMAHPYQFNKYYTSTFIDSEAIGVGDGSTVTFTKALGFKPVKLKTFKLLVNGVVTATDNGAGVISGTGVNGTIDYLTGNVDVTFTVAPANNTKIDASYRYDMELNVLRPKMSLDIQVIPVQAETRSLLAEYSAEAMDDLRALQGLEAEAEFTIGAATEIATELDREIIGVVLEGAITGDPVFGVNTATFDAVPPSGVSKTDHLRGIIFPIARVSEEIHRRTLRNAGNWLITSPRIASVLRTLPFFKKTDPTGYTFKGQILKVGELEEMWDVYKDPLFPDDKILVGFQGPTFLDTGAVFAPYVPIQATPNWTDPRDLAILKTFRTRYALQLVRPEFYGYVNIENASQI